MIVCVGYNRREGERMEELSMSDVNKIVSLDQPPWSIIGGGLHEYNVAQAGDPESTMICLVLQNADEEIVGGIIGVTDWGWFYLNLMWLHETYRGQGYGSRLLEMAEARAREAGATAAYLDTFSFQAIDFYKKFGYQVFGELKDFPPGHQRYYLKKELR